MAEPIIFRRTFGTVDQRAQLSNGQVARSHGLGSNWDRLRLAFRVSMGDVGAALSGTPRLIFGFCSGTTNLPGDLTCDNFFGVYSDAALWTRAAGPPAVQYGNPWKAITIVGVSTVEVGTILNNLDFYDCATAHRSAFMLDITRDGGGLFTLEPVLARISAVADTDADYDLFLGQCSVLAPAMTDHSSSPGFAVQTAVDELGDGPLDSIYFSWDRSVPRVEISDVAVARLA